MFITRDTDRDKVIKYSKALGLIAWNCPKCGLISFGLCTAYHTQLHGKQTIYYNPFEVTKNAD